METPKAGKVRIWQVSGRVSGWVDVEEIKVTPDWIYCEGAFKGITGVQFPLVSVAFLEYATAEEVDKLEKEKKS